MSEPLVQYQVGDRIARVGLNDPARRNALSLSMFDALAAALEAAAGDRSVNVVLLHGSGPVFCSGFDLKEAAADPRLLGRLIVRLGETLRVLRLLPRVVVAAVQGAAVAGGCAIVSACDLAVVSATARLGYPVHRLGLSPAVSTSTLVQAAGAGRARALLLGGRLIEGREARALGLAWSTSAGDENVLPEAERLCREIAGHGPRALAATKAWLNELDGSLDASRYRRPAEDSAGRLDEAPARIAAYLAGRRDPV